MGIGSGPAVGFFPERLLSEKENEMEIPEELVEEIAYLLSCHRFVSNPDVGIVQDRDYAREAITRISQAIENGELELSKVPPELPGEVGRYTYGVHDLSWWGVKINDQIIALRPESHRDPRRGGQEEE